PEMVIWLEPVPRSGIATSVPLVAGGQSFGGGGVEPPGLVYRRMFGEPGRAFVILFGVPTDFSALCTVAGDAVGLLARNSAAAPVTCGVAIDVPLIVLVAVSLSIQADVMPTPGAKMSVQVPKLEKEARASLRSEAFTVIASVTRAGVKLHASALELPEAIEYTTPSAMELRTAFSVVVSVPWAPRLMLATAGCPAWWCWVTKSI